VIFQSSRIAYVVAVAYLNSIGQSLTVIKEFRMENIFVVLHRAARAQIMIAKAEESPQIAALLRFYLIKTSVRVLGMLAAICQSHIMAVSVKTMLIVFLALAAVGDVVMKTGKPMDVQLVEVLEEAASNVEVVTDLMDLSVLMNANALKDASLATVGHVKNVIRLLIGYQTGIVILFFLLDLFANPATNVLMECALAGIAVIQII